MTVGFLLQVIVDFQNTLDYLYPETAGRCPLLRKRQKKLLRALLHPAPALNLLRRSIQKKVKKPNEISKYNAEFKSVPTEPTCSVNTVSSGSPKPKTARSVSPPLAISHPIAQPPSSTIDSNDDTERKSAASGPQSPGVMSEIDDEELERRVALLQKRLLWLANENEEANKRDARMLQTSKNIIARIDILKKSLEEASDDYRRDAQSCNEKIEREEIRQNQLLMDLKERVDKVNDMYNDVDGQVEEISKTLSVYNPSDNFAIFSLLTSFWTIILNYITVVYHLFITLKSTEPSSQIQSPTSAKPKRGTKRCRTLRVKRNRLNRLSSNRPAN
ncbi:hypothetical protein Tcan_04658 [Toxocara canis]|uniref:Uncharacterized protein n=1 Tax=Toxocara canis TaxID=6265 RepID=A0A0B2VKW5_TOXCA|nr:hypothetical protein Tcan_04658 [Toxocara canis]